MLNAEGLALVMNDLFGGVVYAGIDTDKYKYPIGELTSLYFCFYINVMTVVLKQIPFYRFWTCYF